MFSINIGLKPNKRLERASAVKSNTELMLLASSVSSIPKYFERICRSHSKPKHVPQTGKYDPFRFNSRDNWYKCWVLSFGSAAPPGRRRPFIWCSSVVSSSIGALYGIRTQRPPALSIHFTYDDAIYSEIESSVGYEMIPIIGLGDKIWVNTAGADDLWCRFAEKPHRLATTTKTAR